ncbi:oligopeptide/dipeptide ABC transporter ATP-binding protein [Yinghuangia seranimata]|uniref:oligopeptide/dipeptide ABC transporter ATP-binding protein n=1 Tax=Yinghuangia seranimata TaxID=408067 RepID=UPI00248CA6F4|nr:ABC transporter ATP-binding protein [Yinghuangia seranimata]MDI2125278.1 ABC transporter ATP-binding protein [Yinghuangia seranimata]
MADERNHGVDPRVAPEADVHGAEGDGVGEAAVARIAAQAAAARDAVPAPGAGAGVSDARAAGGRVPVLAADQLRRYFPVPRQLGKRGPVQQVHAVEDVSFDVAAGEILAVVGESGCGKSTVARMLAGLTEPTVGRVLVDGAELPARRTPEQQRVVQLVTQNPRAAFNRRRGIRHALHQPLRVHGLAAGAREREAAAVETVRRVGLSEEHLDRMPRDLSGGELARLVLARALLVGPRVLVLDEPTASLDASVKATVVNLLLRLRDELGLAIVVITHEIDIARRLADRAAVMYLGRVVELGPAAEVLHAPRHPYARMLLASVPRPDPTRTGPALAADMAADGAGEVPSAVTPPSGCAFHPRCPLATQVCAQEVPEERMLGGVRVMCHHAEDAGTETGAETAVETAVDGSVSGSAAAR